MPADLLADIALRAPLRNGSEAIFSYRVPPHLRGLVLPGQLVWVPLRRQKIQGVVLRTHTETIPLNGSLREVLDLADPAATITPSGLRLARWVAETYRAPLYEALALFLPPGVSQAAEITWRTTATGLAIELGTLPERERAVLYYLRTRGEITERELRRELRGSDSELRETYAALYERGLLVRGAVISAPRARPRTERVAHLHIDAEQLTTALDDLQRAPKQQAVLRWLAAHAAEARRHGDMESQLPTPNSQLPTPNSQLPTSTPQPPITVREISAATGATLAMLRTMEKKGLLALNTREVRRDPLAGDGVQPDHPPQLTAGQSRVWQTVADALDQMARRHDQVTAAAPAVFLLHGVTGSGKTEIYLRAIGRALRLGKQALVLVPEIALTTQLVRRFAARFPGKLAVLHSGLSLGERYDEWRRLRQGVARLAIGSRSAVFAPLPELGLIIVDEEHEPTYKHDGSPRYHARDAALHLGALTESVVMLGSATPSVESYHATQTGKFTLIEMTERVGHATTLDGLSRTQTLPLPHVRLVDMRHELQHGNRSIFSRPLQQALSETLERHEQAILFLNRRGAASFVMCRDCGYVVTCPACSGPLVVHYDDEERTIGARQSTPDAPPPTTVLICHSCGYRDLVPTICTRCLSPRIRSFGIGTQRVAEEAQRLFPAARVLRWDRDTVTGKGAHGRMLDRFLQHEADILVGTQMIAKGLDLPLVTVVGAVTADTGLHMPDFRSGERTFQLLTQVAGRAGRRAAGAQVILQTYTAEHYALQAAQEHNYHAFYEQEIAFRRQTGYPPFGRLVRFVYASGSAATCERVATELAARITQVASEQGLSDWSLIGPAPAFMQRMRGRWRWHLLLRTPDPLPLLQALEPLYGWTVDVDPVHVL